MNLQIFEYKNHNFRTLLDSNMQPWWVADDVCQLLDIKDVRQAVERLDEDEKLIGKIYQSGQNRDMWLISESGLYTLVIRSNKPEAKPFRRWVTHEVLPSIRRTGMYKRDLVMRYVLPECREWVKTFEEEFYQEIYRLRGWKWGAYGKKHPPFCAQITNKWVYDLLPDGVSKQLSTQIPRTEHGYLVHKKHQLLTKDIGLPHLQSHMLQVIRLMRASYSWEHFEELASMAFRPQIAPVQMKLLVVA